MSVSAPVWSLMCSSCDVWAAFITRLCPSRGTCTPPVLTSSQEPVFLNNTLKVSPRELEAVYNNLPFHSPSFSITLSDAQRSQRVAAQTHWKSCKRDYNTASSREERLDVMKYHSREWKERICICLNSCFYVQKAAESLKCCIFYHQSNKK